MMKQPEFQIEPGSYVAGIGDSETHFIFEGKPLEWTEEEREFMALRQTLEEVILQQFATAWMRRYGGS